jgi:hypothetical protein
MIGHRISAVSDTPAGRGIFDDRSTAFGVAALAYSHAVTDARTSLPLRLALGRAAPDERPILDQAA